MKNAWENIKNALRWRNIRRAYFHFLEEKISWVIFFLIFLLFGYSTYIWYFYVFHPGWSEDKKKQYIEEKGKGTELNRTKLDEAIKNYNSRGDNFNKSSDSQEDIFRLNANQ